MMVEGDAGPSRERSVTGAPPYGSRHVELVMFDLDGTLVDTLAGIANAINRASKKHGYPPMPLKRIRGLIGNGGSALAEAVLSDAGRPSDSERIRELHRSYLEEYQGDPLHGAVLYGGVVAVLDRLASSRVPMAVCTNKATTLALLILEGLGLAGYFEHILCGDSLQRCKPDPCQLDYVIERVGARRDASVMVGDHDLDIAAARAAGVRSVYAAFGYGGAEVPAVQPDIAISHYCEFEMKLEQIGINYAIS